MRSTEQRPLRRLRVFLSAVTIVLVLLVAGIAACNIYVALTSAPFERSEAAAPAAPYAIVLGARAFPDERPTIYLRERIALAARIFHAGKAQNLDLSGNDSARDPEVRTMRAELERAGVPGAHLIDDTGGFDTRATCERASHVFGVKRALVLSQRFHIPRAVFLCRRAGIDVVGVGAPDWGTLPPRSVLFETLRESLATVKAVFNL